MVMSVPSASQNGSGRILSGVYRLRRTGTGEQDCCRSISVQSVKLNQLISWAKGMQTASSLLLLVGIEMDEKMYSCWKRPNPSGHQTAVGHRRVKTVQIWSNKNTKKMKTETTIRVIWVRNNLGLGYSYFVDRAKPWNNYNKEVI